MGEAAEVLELQPNEVSTRALSIIDQGRTIVIKTTDDYRVAGGLWATIKGVMKQVDDSFDPIISKAHQAHKEAVAQKAKIYDPLKAVYVSVKGLMSKWDQTQEAIRLAEQRRLEEIARKEEAERRRVELERLETERKAEEDRLMEAAAAAEKAGDAKRAEELAAAAITATDAAADEAAFIMSEPVYVAPVVLPKETPKLAGGPVYRTIWKFRIYDVGRIPRQYLVPDEVKIGQVVRALKKEHGIMGVEAYEERC